MRLLIVGLGIDMVDLGEFRKRLSDELIAELFLPAEIDYCRTQHRFWENFGARFAAKEAVFKALGAGLEQGLRWHDVEVVRSSEGPVSVVLTGPARKAADRLQVTRSFISLSHCRDAALAAALLERDDTPRSSEEDPL